ncbi:extracellular solute-binding protein [Shouchella hunanensis]|uniref:Extracellular solute-binding protein n=1 Tax=Shouchella hunanensis TaxID=766894 RepID=A0ABY7WC40_9BACI|nr:extracellular solute-binding protein [Shouchella hunanensis]WDF05367.1 extracellular solute-binding protein [Shouchella hunanensis]
MLKRSSIVCLTILGFLAYSQPTVAETTETLEELELSYDEVYQSNKDEYGNKISDSQHFTVNQFKEYEGIDQDYINWATDGRFTVEVDVAEAGLYEIGVAYRVTEETLVPSEGAILINGHYPFSESRGMIFPSEWIQNETTFEQDRYGADIMPSQSQLQDWQTFRLGDSRRVEPFAFALEQGQNTIEFKHVRGEMDIAHVTIEPVTEISTYDTYISDIDDEEVINDLITIEAEHPSKKNESSIRPIVTQDPSVSPYETGARLLNTFGGDSWKVSGQSACWSFEISESGFYYITFKALANNDANKDIYRTIYVNGRIPFAELKSYPFPQSAHWENQTLANDANEPFRINLEAGMNELCLRVDDTPTQEVQNELTLIMAEMDELTLSIKQLTGNQQDASRGWRIEDYIPDVSNRLRSWAQKVETGADKLRAASTSEGDSVQGVSLRVAGDRLRSLAETPNELPNRLNELSEGSSSVSQVLGDVSIALREQPLLLDQLFIHGKTLLPDAEAGLWMKTKESVSRFFQSFSGDDLTTVNTEHDVVEVWVNRPRQYVDLMQLMADQQFTPETGIEVRFSLMPDEQKLILASAADSQPDLALGISNWLPYELAIRGAAVDLSQFDDFDDYMNQFAPGAFMPLMIEDSIYALPETQDFSVLFYREDLMDALSLPVPNTWGDVVDILPELQRYGMNFYSSIAGGAAFKPFAATAPFIYQFQGQIFEKDGMGVALNEDEALQGVQFMADLNTIYSTPLQVPNFYNHFRYGSLPLGIGNFATYVQLTSAAQELSGWDIALHPGVEQEDGSVSRWASGAAQAGMMFNGSDNQEQAWALLQWWMSKETQREFAQTLQMTYGAEYMWNTANLEAFKELPWPEEHKDVILTQWEQLIEVPKTPYAYMVEREISNVWNKMVFDGENARSAVDDSIITIDRELRRKMEEFGYMQDGEVIRPYPIPTIEAIKQKTRESE